MLSIHTYIHLKQKKNGNLILIKDRKIKWKDNFKNIISFDFDRENENMWQNKKIQKLQCFLIQFDFTKLLQFEIRKRQQFYKNILFKIV